MKKNFKKSKFVILPALATLVLTGVASVTGTVAWFTANRTVKASASQFKAEAEGGALSITTSPLTGTTVDKENGNNIVVDGVLTHGSYDFTNLYTVTILDDNPTAYVSLGNATLNNNEWLAYTKTDQTKVWYGVAWKWTISYNAVSTTDKIAVILDQKESNYSKVSGANGGFEIAMSTNSNTPKQIVFGNNNVKTHVSKAGNIAGNIGDGQAGETGEFTNTDNLHYLVNDNGYTRKKDKQSQTTYTEDGGYIATLDSDTNSVDVTCVAWYEGTDPVVVTDKIVDEVITASFTFYSRSIKTGE